MKTTFMLSTNFTKIPFIVDRTKTLEEDSNKHGYYDPERMKKNMRIILIPCKNISIICTIVNLSRHFCCANNNCSTIIK